MARNLRLGRFLIVIVGALWALLHVTADLQAGRALDWIAWHRLGTVVLRILMVWLYNNTGHSTFAVILFHDMVNVGMYMYPNLGSHYDPLLTLLITGAMAAAVVVIWGPRTLAGDCRRGARGPASRV